jgi:hypothetical protein
VTTPDHTAGARVLPALVFLLAPLFFDTGCSSVSPVVGARAEAARAAYERARAAAWAPRRFKALFKVEVSPKIGAMARGYLSVFWDGRTLVWRSSAPLAGAGKGGLLRSGEKEDGKSSTKDLFPGKIASSDVLAALLGAPAADVSSSSPFEERSGVIVLPLADGERTAGIDASGRIAFLGFPGGVRVRLQPGEGVPRRIEATGPDGRALLALETFGAWPEGEGVPP